MTSAVAWITALALAVGATVAAPAFADPRLQMAVCGTVALLSAIAAITARLRLAAVGKPPSAEGSLAARFLGFVWAWGGLSILITYVGVIAERWPEWWQFFIGFSAAATASFAFAGMLDRDAATGKSDVTINRFGRILLWVQIVGIAAAVATMFVDHKFPRAIAHADWAGCNIFFFGALAIIAISLDALRSRVSV